MGEQPTGRRLALVGVLLASLFAGLVTAETGDVQWTSSVEPVDRPWYDVDHPLVLTPSLVNVGPAVELLTNPQCEVALNVYNATGVLVVNGVERCPSAEQGMNLDEGDSHTYDALTWDMKDETGDWLESGSYTVEVVHVGSGMSERMSATIQTPVTLPSSLKIAVEPVARDSVANGTVVYIVNLHNPTTSPVDLSDIPTCRFEIKIGDEHSLGPSCIGGLKRLMPGELLLVDHLALRSEVATTVTLTTPGDQFSTEFVLTPSAPTVAVEGLKATFVPDDTSTIVYDREGTLNGEVVLELEGEQSQTIVFDSSCKADVWVVNDLGEVVFDSREGTTCQPINLETTVSRDSPLVISVPQWRFFNEDGCKVDPGTYTVVAEVPQFGLVDVHEVKYIDWLPKNCGLQTPALLDLTSTWLDEDRLRLEPTLSTVLESQHLRMQQPCAFQVDFVDTNGQRVHHDLTSCDVLDGRKLLLNNQTSTIALDSFEVNMIQDGMAIVPEGEYTLTVTFLSVTPSQTSIDIVWPSTFTSEVDEEPVEEVLPPTFDITGTWVGLMTESGTCFALEDGGDSYLLAHARTLGSWTPTSSVQGMYTVREASVAPACAGFSAPSVEVVVVLHEAPLTTEESSVVEEVSTPVVTEEQATIAPVATVVTVVVTTSVLSFVLAIGLTNEGLRIPATMAGLWFLGLVGKTHETTDGRYQRGRLMGYLTANPGCHFRALMSALDMSNGQITHHLRILEAEENVWRKSDGRLVRYYPFTNQLHPHMDEDDLPVPLLSPDPNSLQGKILAVLDHDGAMGQFPTQAELAKRLEKSQQLISHHLRTLQKYGLVERRKMGVKNRYKLTREAIFLLETSEDLAPE